MGAIKIHTSVTRSKWKGSEIFGVKFHLLYVLYMYNNNKNNFLLSMWEAILKPIYLFHKREDLAQNKSYFRYFELKILF